MKRIILVSALFISTIAAFAQVSAESKITKIYGDCSCFGMRDPAKQPIWIVNGELIQGHVNLNSLEPDYLMSFKVIRDSTVLAKYGDASKNGVIEIVIKDDIKLQSLKKILERNKVEKEKAQLPIYFKEYKVEEDFIFVQSNKKIKIEIIQANLDADKRMPYNGKYLSITETM